MVYNNVDLIFVVLAFVCIINNNTLCYIFTLSQCGDIAESSQTDPQVSQTYLEEKTEMNGKTTTHTVHFKQFTDGVYGSTLTLDSPYLE